MRVLNDVWRVRINKVEVAIVHLPGSDKDWSLIDRFRDMVKESAGPDSRVTLSSDANERGVLV